MARDRSGSTSRTERMASQLVQRLVDAGVDGVGPLDPALEVAESARAKAGSVEAAVDDVVRSHRRLAAAGGFVAGVGGFVTSVVALPANVAGFYVVATRMVAAVAHLRGYDLAREEVRAAVLLTLLGADADEILGKVGVVVPGGRIRNLALQRLPRPALMVVNKAIGFRLLSQLGSRGLARLGRVVPVAGGVVGAALDAWLLNKIAAAAREEFVQR
jgi:hypothetical protein